MPRRAPLLPFLVLAAQLACVHGSPRPLSPGETFALDDVSLRAPPEPGWTVDEGGAGDHQWIRFRRPARYPAEAREAAAGQSPRAARPGSPGDLLEEVRQENREARARVDDLHLELTEERLEPSDRFGPLTVRFAGRAVHPAARRGAEAVLMRGYVFVLPDRPDRSYRVRYLEVAPEWSPGTGFEERAEAFFSGVALPGRPGGGDRGQGRVSLRRALAAGPAAVSLRGVPVTGLAVQMPLRAGLPLRGAAGELGMEINFDLFAGRNEGRQRGAFSLSTGVMAYRSWERFWLGGGLDLGYATLTRLRGGPRLDGVLVGPHLGAGLDLYRLRWGTPFLRLDLVTATPGYYRAGALLGVHWGW